MAVRTVSAQPSGVVFIAGLSVPSGAGDAGLEQALGSAKAGSFECLRADGDPGRQGPAGSRLRLAPNGAPTDGSRVGCRWRSSLLGRVGDVFGLHRLTTGTLGCRWLQSRSGAGVQGPRGSVRGSNQESPSGVGLAEQSRRGDETPRRQRTSGAARSWLRPVVGVTESQGSMCETSKGPQLCGESARADETQGTPGPSAGCNKPALLTRSKPSRW